MDEEEKQLRLYQTALEEVRHEGDLLWQQFGSFLLVQTVFLAFLLQSALREGIILQFDFGIIFSALIGFGLCLPWYGTFRRTKKFYGFRLAQANEAEPKNWKFLAERGKMYAEGKEVKIGEKSFKMNWFERKLKPTNSAVIVIFFFAAIYLLIFIINLTAIMF
jgi:hypothetical protein